VKIKTLFQSLRENELINTSLLTGIGTVIAQVSGVVIMKIVALTFGASGVALISQFVDFVTLSTSVASGGIQQGVVKYTAQYKQDDSLLLKVLSSSLRVTIISATVIGIIIYYFAVEISSKLFQTNEYTYIIQIFAFNCIFFALNTLLVRILNGIGNIKKLVIINITSSLLTLVLVVLLLRHSGFPGALMALSVTQSIVFLIALRYTISLKLYNKVALFKRIDMQVTLKLLAFTAMGICTLVLGPLVNIGIRNYLAENISIGDAGIWSGMIKLSNSYLSIVTITLSYYYLPKLSSISGHEMIRLEIFQGQKTVLPLLAMALLLLYRYRLELIFLVYSEEFARMERFFLPQLLGDFIKIASFFLSYLLIAKAKAKMYILLSVVFAIITYFLTIFMAERYGAIGAVYAHPVIYSVYLVTLVYSLREYVFAR